MQAAIDDRWGRTDAVDLGEAFAPPPPRAETEGATGGSSISTRFEPDHAADVRVIIRNHAKCVHDVGVLSERLNRRENVLKTGVNMADSINLMYDELHQIVLGTSNGYDRDELQTLHEWFSNFSSYLGIVMARWIRHEEEDLRGVRVDLQRATSDLAAYRDFMRSAVRTASEDRGHDVGPLTCPICQEHDVRTCLAPCGHVFCTECEDRMVYGRCFSCRTPIERKIRMFFS